MNAYASLIRAFLTLSAPDQATVSQEPGALQFTVNDQTCTVIPLDDGARLVLQARAQDLGGWPRGRVAAAHQLLHGLNWAMAVRTGIMALVDDRQQVLVSRLLDTASLDAPALAEHIAQLLESAPRLRAVLDDLPDPSPADSGGGARPRMDDAPPLGDAQRV